MMLAVYDRPASTLVLRLAHDGQLRTLDLVEAPPPPPPPRDAATLVTPRYACGGCGVVLFAGAPLAHVVPRGPRPAGVRCPSCGAVNLTQVNGRRRPPA